MTRVLAFLTCLILVFGLCVGASAAGDTFADAVQIIATVSNDGSCQVTATINLHVGDPNQALTFPVPADATNITLNGSRVMTEKTDQARLVDLNKVLAGMSGDFTFSIAYSLHSVITPVESATEPTEETTETNQTPLRKFRVELPLLSGFPYPIDQFQFSINMPNVVSQNPSFISGYHQANIEKDLTYSHSGSNIAGRSWTALKDHETLVMYLDATEEMFPQTRAELPTLDAITGLITVCVVLALLYWILFLRNFLPWRSYPAVAPEGFGAGQLGTVLTMAGTDLSLMAFSWAQLGYVTLRMDRRGRVFIIKRMDMGNERTAFEQKCFYNLFARRDMIDTGSMGYARMYQSVAVQKAASQLFQNGRPGNVKIFRVLCAIAGCLCGTCFGIILGNLLDFGWLFMLGLSAVGLVCSWNIQLWPQGIFLHLRPRFWIALALSLLWLALGFATGQLPLAIASVLIQIVAGFLASFGGRRSEEGRTAMGQTLTLRSHLKKLSSRQIQLQTQENPLFFFDMLPDAIALGCEASFARRFGKGRMPVCPYVQASNTRGLTATQWSQLMRQILDGMTARQRHLPLENLRAVMGNYMK
jgi:hypothetical protein